MERRRMISAALLHIWFSFSQAKIFVFHLVLNQKKQKSSTLILIPGYIRGMQELMSLVAAGLAQIFLIQLFDLRIFVALTYLHGFILLIKSLSTQSL